MKPGENCLHVTPHFLQSKLIFEFRWTGLTITTSLLKRPREVINAPNALLTFVYTVRSCVAFVPAAKPPDAASNAKAAFFQKLSITMLCLSLGFHFFLSFFLRLHTTIWFRFYLFQLLFAEECDVYYSKRDKNRQRNVTKRE